MNQLGTYFENYPFRSKNKHLILEHDRQKLKVVPGLGLGSGLKASSLAGPSGNAERNKE